MSHGGNRFRSKVSAFIDNENILFQKSVKTSTAQNVAVSGVYCESKYGVYGIYTVRIGTK